MYYLKGQMVLWSCSLIYFNIFCQISSSCDWKSWNMKAATARGIWCSKATTNKFVFFIVLVSTFGILRLSSEKNVQIHFYHYKLSTNSFRNFQYVFAIRILATRWVIIVRLPIILFWSNKLQFFSWTRHFLS